jgi:hypothetical protein
MSITILLATASDALGDAVRLALGEEPGLTLVGQAVNFRQTMHLTSELKPSVFCCICIGQKNTNLWLLS